MDLVYIVNSEIFARIYFCETQLIWSFTKINPSQKRNHSAVLGKSCSSGKFFNGTKMKILRKLVNLCKMATLKKTTYWFSRLIIDQCMSKVLQNAPRGAFCNTLDLYFATCCHKDLCFVYVWVAILHRFYCM